MSQNPNEFDSMDIDIDIDFGAEGDGLEVESEAPSESLLEQINAINGVQGLSAEDLMGLEMEDGLTDGDDLVIEDGTNLELNLEDLSSDGLDAAELLSTQLDISATFISYYQAIHNSLQKIQSLQKAEQNKRTQTLPNFAEFGFIPNAHERQLVFGVFCAILTELTTKPEYANLTEDQAYSKMLSELYQELHWSPNIHNGKLQQVFSTFYSKNKKLAQFQEFSNQYTLASLVDLKRVTEAETVYNINSLPFDMVTKFFARPELINGSISVRVEDHTEFLTELRADKSRNLIPHTDIYNIIVTYLTSDDTLSLLRLSEDARADFSIGELLRRFILHELKEGTFYPIRLKTMVTAGYSQQLLDQLYTSLIEGQKKNESFAAEILCLIIELMADNTDGDDGLDEYFYTFIVSLARYLSAFVNDSSSVNPVFYTLIGNVEKNTDGETEYELGYVDNDETILFRTADVLYDVVGDNYNVYHIPYVYIDTRRGVAVCPPPEVKDSIFKVTATGRMSVSGTVAYRYAPTFAWLSTLSIASINEVEEKVQHGLVVSKTAGALLDTLMRYDNKFDLSGTMPSVVTVDAGNACSFIGLQRDNRDTVDVLQLVLPESNDTIYSENSVCAADDDGSLIVRYWSPVDKSEQVLLLEPNNYSMSKSAAGEASNLSRGNTIINLANLFAGGLDITWEDAVTYYKEVAIRICELNGLDYNAELKNARRIIMRDLPRIINVNAIDQMLGVLTVRSFFKFIEQSNENLDRFNLNTLKELADILFGRPNLLTDATVLTPELVQRLREEVDKVEATEASLVNVYKHLEDIDLHLLALQVCSRHELKQECDSTLYYALHYIPSIHSKLCELENQMVLLHALVEADGDIAPVLKKTSALRSAYNSVCTKSSIFSVETALQKDMKIKEVPPCFSVTREVIFNTLPENLTILKYFVLERNVYGMLCELEEMHSAGHMVYDSKYTAIKDALGLPESMDVSAYTELEFYQIVDPDKVKDLFSTMAMDCFVMVIDGLIVEASKSLDIQVLKCYDMITAYGRYMFNISPEKSEDFTNTREFEDAFNRYVGSFVLSYCPVLGEAEGEIESGYDRYTAYLRNRKDFHPFINLSDFDGYTLTDLKLVAGSNLLQDGDNDGA